jgi:hypothetical protein
LAYAWWVFAHVLAVFLFLMVHGIAAGVSIALRREHDPPRLQALLDLSSKSVGFTHLSMFLVLVTGLALAQLGNWWRAGWIWASLGLFLATWAAMFWFGTKRQDRMRAAVGAKPFYAKKGAPVPIALPAEAQEGLLRARRPMALAAFGTVVLGAFLWMMMFKPF